MEWHLRDEIAEIIGEDVFEYADHCDGLSIADKIIDLLERCSADEPAGSNSVPEGADQ